MNNTILFTPCIVDTEERLQRNIKWLEYYLHLKELLGYDDIVMVDNASPPDKLAILQNRFPEVVFIKKHIRLERINHLSYPYWYRAFKEVLQYARNRAYNKIIHIDSDGFLLSPKICEFFKTTDAGWHSLYCSAHKFPETIFQIIGSDQIDAAYDFMSEGYLQTYPTKQAEDIVPFTHVHKHFIGDRYPDKGIKKQDASWDYIGQCPLDMQIKFNP